MLRKIIKNYFSFEGRIRRGQYIPRIIIVYALVMAFWFAFIYEIIDALKKAGYDYQGAAYNTLAIVDALKEILLNNVDGVAITAVIVMVISIVGAVSALSLTARRLQDFGIHGAAALIPFVIGLFTGLEIVNMAVRVIIMFIPGNKDANKYGAVPE